MAESQKFDLLLLDGGLNESAKPTHIEDNELAELENLFVQDRALRRRGGTKRLTSSAYAEKLTSLFPYKKAVGTWLLLIGARQSIAKLDGSEIVKIPHVDQDSFTDDPNPWSMKQYNDITYAARKNGGRLKHIDGFRILDAGIPAPTAAASAAEGAAGLLPAGTYRYVVTFTNRDTGAEGNFSPEVAVTIAANKKVNLSSIPTSTNAQVNGRKIYRSLKDATGEYFLVDTINDPFTTTFTDNIEDENLLRSASVKNGLPPAGLEFIEIWRQRLWGTDGRDLFSSQPGKPEQFDPNFIIQVFPDDGHEIRGIRAYGDRFLVGKTNQTHYLVGTGTSNFELHTLSDKHGVGAGHSMAVAEGVALWLGMDDFYITDGQSVRGIGTQKIRKKLDAIPPSLRDRATSYVVPEHGWYVTNVPQDTSDGFDLELVYNYKLDVWDTRKRTTLGAPVYAGEFVDVNFDRIQYAAFDGGHLYQLGVGNDDDGDPIVAKFRTKAFGFEANNILKWIRRLHLLMPSIAENLTVRIYRDQETTAIATKTVDLNQPRPWKRLGINNAGRLGATVSIELEYSGTRDFQVNGLSFELVQQLRSSKVL